MARRVWLVPILLLGCSHWVRIPPGDPRLRFTGRVDLSDPAGPRFSNTGTSVAVRVSAPALRLHLRDVPYRSKDGRREPDRYELLIDGAPAGVLVAQEPEWRQAVELGPGEHVVELFKRTEPEVGQGQLLGVELPAGGRLLDPPERPRRRIEFLGDSLTTGFGNLGAGPDCPFGAATEDGYRAYAALAGRMLQAEVHVVAWGGRGVVRNYDLGSTDTLPQLYERTLPEDPASRWDFSRWTPDAVVIYAGANDFNRPGFDAGAFERGYAALVRRVRERYPQAFILCAYPWVTDATPSREAMDRVMKRLAEGGLTRAKVFAFDPATPEQGLGCLWHPSLATHQAMARQLRAVLAGALGWGE